MKKNKTLRVALVLCVLAIFCAALVGSTFAKYVTGDQTADTARVSKWGVTVTYKDLNTNDDLTFNKEYATEDAGTNSANISVSVKSNDDKNMVAPGTADAGFSFTIEGTPEVATKVDIHMDVNKDVFLGKGADYAAATAVAHNAYNGTANYYPLVFTLTATGVNGANAFGENVNSVTGNLKLIENTLETWANTAYKAPNADLGIVFTLTWAWEYGSYNAENTYESATKADIADTKLGDLAADVFDTTYTATTEGIAPTTTTGEGDEAVTTAGSNFCTEVDFTLKITVTQMN